MPDLVAYARGGAIPAYVQTLGPTIPSNSGPAGARFAKFVADYGLTAAALGNVVDFEGGHVLVRTLHPTTSESERRIGALLALINAQRTGEFEVDRSSLVKACEEHGVYDRPNFSGNFKDFEFNGSTVFLKTDNGYKVSRPGEAYVADVVKALGSATGAEASP